MENFNHNILRTTILAALIQPLRQSFDTQTHNIIVDLNCIMFGTGLEKKHIKTATFKEFQTL